MGRLHNLAQPCKVAPQARFSTTEHQRSPPGPRVWRGMSIGTGMESAVRSRVTVLTPTMSGMDREREVSLTPLDSRMSRRGVPREYSARPCVRVSPTRWLRMVCYAVAGTDLLAVDVGCCGCRVLWMSGSRPESSHASGCKLRLTVCLLPTDYITPRKRLGERNTGYEEMDGYPPRKSPRFDDSYREAENHPPGGAERPPSNYQSGATPRSREYSENQVARHPESARTVLWF